MVKCTEDPQGKTHSPAQRYLLLLQGRDFGPSLRGFREMILRVVPVLGGRWLEGARGGTHERSCAQWETRYVTVPHHLQQASLLLLCFCPEEELSGEAEFLPDLGYGCLWGMALSPKEAGDGGTEHQEETPTSSPRLQSVQQARGSPILEYPGVQLQMKGSRAEL